MQNQDTSASVHVVTELGSFFVTLDLQRAPISSRNFLSYVDQRLFDGTSFFRIVTPYNQPEAEVKISVIQGGLKAGDPRALPAVPHEPTSVTGLHHTNGAISMARPKNASGSSSFFICIGDQPELDYGGRRYEDHVGFAAFGYVTAGMDILYKIYERSEDDPYLRNEICILTVRRS
jgi:peptidyl-prolyl cis-trans isomerase A (cyclophilin A)